MTSELLDRLTAPHGFGGPSRRFRGWFEAEDLLAVRRRRRATGRRPLESPSEAGGGQVAAERTTDGARPGEREAPAEHRPCACADCRLRDALLAPLVLLAERLGRTP